MTLAQKAYDSLRRDIIRGVLEPGSPLRLAELSRRYDMGFSPLREAMNRLQAERLVSSQSLRGFRVASWSAAQMEDAVNTRILIESEALRAAIRHGNDDWAAGIVASLYALRLQVERRGEARDLWELEARHHAFHRALLAGCDSPWLLELFEQLYAATERYRIPILMDNGPNPARDIHAEHAALAEAALARDAGRAADLLGDHYRRTAELLAARMAAPACQRA